MQPWGDNDVISQIYMTGVLKTVSIICTKSPIFTFDFPAPKGSLGQQ